MKKGVKKSKKQSVEAAEAVSAQDAADTESEEESFAEADADESVAVDLVTLDEGLAGDEKYNPIDLTG